MKKILIAVMALALHTTLISCTDEAVAEETLLYDTQATEGEEGETNEEPDA